MNKYAHVVHSYLCRPRFWIFAACYLAFSCLDSPQAQQPVICGSVLFASIVTGLGALHVRRQFATPQARLMPDFFVPHFVVAVVASGLVWIAVPWWEATHMHVHPLVVISAHALAAVLMAAVVLWAKAIILIPAAPMFVVWLITRRRADDTFALRFMAGEEWGVYWGLIGLAVVGYGLAAWRLARLSDINVATSDDFSLEKPRGEFSNNPLIERLLSWRDAQLDRRLMAGAGRGPSFAFRRIPSTISWQELALFSGLILALMPIVWYSIGDSAGGWLAMTAGTGLMLFQPLSSWRFRCNALAMEFMRPAARSGFMRQMVLAMALDFCLWTLVATAVAVCGYLVLLGQYRFTFWIVLAGHTTILWGLAVLLFGIGLATLRFRAWMPLFIGILVASIITAGYAVSFAEEWHRNHRGAFPSGYLVFGTFSTVCAIIGLLLAWCTYRHWLRMDLS